MQHWRMEVPFFFELTGLALWLSKLPFLSLSYGGTRCQFVISCAQSYACCSLPPCSRFLFVSRPAFLGKPTTLFLPQIQHRLPFAMHLQLPENMSPNPLSTPLLPYTIPCSGFAAPLPSCIFPLKPAFPHVMDDSLSPAFAFDWSSTVQCQ